MASIASPSLTAIILAAGKSSRMHTALPKPLHQVAGKPMLDWVMTALAGAGAGRMLVVVSPELQAQWNQGGNQARNQGGDKGLGTGKNHKISIETVAQSKALGTGDAVMTCLPHLKKAKTGDGVVLIGFADTPLISSATLQALAKLISHGNKGVACLGFETATPHGYGRIIQNESGEVVAIIEEKDADAETRKIGLVNGGVMAVREEVLLALAPRLTSDNKAGEKYLTDIVGLARDEGEAVGCLITDQSEVLGVNTRADLAEVEAMAQARLRQRALTDGVSLLAPDTVFLSYDSVIEADVVIHPHVVIAPGVHIEAGAEVKSFTHIEGAHIGKGASIGPFARIRPGSDLADGTRIGNFVETKNIRMQAGAKANHLAYLGDAEIGEEANIGAGAITCNYDGVAKSTTRIGGRAFIGSNTALVAPVTIGDEAIVAAGSTISRDVPSRAVVIERNEAVVNANAAPEYLAKRKKHHAKK